MKQLIIVLWVVAGIFAVDRYVESELLRVISMVAYPWVRK